ncbi:MULTISPECIES: YciI family protein [unclassified Exiguobacterium]|uniref:YciI family protein n=2 Tax=Exiguobacterium TaxID=33986 RepID=UPI001BE8DB5B|nr:MULTISPECIES: YciI family protein [unclassified Exiguobacterium]
MIFLFIGYYDAEKMNQSSQEELDAVMERCNPPLEDFFEKTNVLYEWRPGEETKHARLLDGQIERQDGPDTRKAEQIGSLILFEADDLEQAVDLALLHPTTQLAEAEQYGWRMEVRPLLDVKDA